MTNNNQNQGQNRATADDAENTDARRDNGSKPSAERGNTDKMTAEIRKSWSRLTDEDARLYEKQPDLFFAKIKEKHGIGREEAQKRLTEVEAACGSCGTEKAA